MPKMRLNLDQPNCWRNEDCSYLCQHLSSSCKSLRRRYAKNSIKNEMLKYGVVGYGYNMTVHCPTVRPRIWSWSWKVEKYAWMNMWLGRSGEPSKKSWKTTGIRETNANKHGKSWKQDTLYSTSNESSDLKVYHHVTCWRLGSFK